ncbi:hypothetical protein ACN6K9_007594, partial [Streptomyces sp. SAS_267]|uniref:hypothetical protein n=1 Tax=Streptomyces sp. SAS_267 TaxID=3412750 RepID=UPI00403C0C4E
HGVLGRQQFPQRRYGLTHPSVVGAAGCRVRDLEGHQGAAGGRHRREDETARRPTAERLPS